MPEPFNNLISGETLPATESNLQHAITMYDEQIGVLYRHRDKLQVALAELRGPAVLPPKHRQTDKQRRVDRCPRCGGREVAV